MSETTTTERPPLAQARDPAMARREIEQSGKMIAKAAGGGTVAKFFDLHKDAITAVLPQHMTADRMMKIALRALRTTPKLMECTISSLFGAVVTCAQLGLEPNTPQGHIYLIPFQNRKKGVFEVQVIIGYKGLIDLARRSGEIVSISSHEVCKGDPFDIAYGTEEIIAHSPKIDGPRGDITGFYAVAKLKGGGTQFEYMPLADITAIRDASQGYKTAKDFNNDKTPWISNFVQMGRKTVIRRLCNYLPMSIELATATALEGRMERGETQDMSEVLNGDFTVLADDAPAEYDAETGEITDQSEADQPATTARRRGRPPKDAAPAQTSDTGQAQQTGDPRQDAPAQDQGGDQRQAEPEQSRSAPATFNI